MQRESFTQIPCLLALILIGCASANDAGDEEDPNGDTPSTSSAPNRPNNGNSGASSSAPSPATGSGGSTNGPSSVGQSGAGGSPARPSAAGGQPSASGGRPSASAGAPSDEEDEQSSESEAGSGGTPASGGSSSTPPPSDLPDDIPSFASDILPILRTSCGSCHSTGFLPRFAASNVDSAYAVAVDLSVEIVNRLDAGTMPPACSRNPPGSSGCISVADFEQIEGWVDGDTPE